MQLFQSFILLIIGFVFLIKGADFFVDGSASIAKQLNDGSRHGDKPSGMFRQRDRIARRQ